MADVPATANNLHTAPGATALLMAGFNKQLQNETVQDEVFDSFSAELGFDEKGAVVPEAAFLKLDAQPTGTNSVTVPMLMALKANGQFGAGNAMLGNEESL